MTDVFISYAREDRDRAHKLANALAAFGWSVWWDRKIITGEAFDQAIERELETAKSIVVLWSEHSIASEWVKNEAAAASERGVLVPALIDSVKLPLEFRRKQTADLIGWDGEPSHSGFQALCEGISAKIGIHRREESAQWVGRERSLQRLHHHLERALGGERQVVFVSGEAGIGKSTLIGMFLRGMSMLGLGVLWARCIEHFGGGEALLPLIEALERQCRSVGGAGLVAKLRHYAPTWLVQMPAVVTSSEREVLQREVLGATKERMLREFCELLEALSREGPLVLVLEDLHWSDYATLDVLTLLARRRDRAPLLVIGTHRPVEMVLRRHPLRAVQQELQIQGLCAELPLDNLSSTEVSAYLAQRFPGNEIPEVVAEVIYRRTEGHPLFMVNLIAYLIAEGRLVQGEGRWTLPQGEASLDVGVPDNLRQMITHQIERLSPEEQRLLGVASVADAGCSAALLAAALNAALSDVESCCEALVRHGHMLAAAGVEEWPDGTVAGRYAFLHALYVEILYRRLAPGSRVELHRRLGERLEVAYGERSGEIATELALHFEQGRDAQRAINYLQQAAEHSARRFANREAIAYLRRALDLVERLPKPVQTEVRIALLQRCAAVRCSMYDMQGAINDLTAMLNSAREAGHRLWEVKALVDLSRMYFLLDQRRGLELADEAVERSQPLADEVVKTLVRGHHAHLNIYFGWRDVHAQTCREALAAARLTNDPHILSRCLIAQAFCECYSSHYRAASAAAMEGMQMAERGGDGYLFMSCQFLRAMTLVLLGAWGEARQIVSEGLAAAEKNGNSMLTRRCRLVTVLLHSEAGDFEGARAHGEAVLAMMAQGSDPMISILSQLFLCKAYLGLRDYPRAFECLNEITRGVEGEDILLDCFSNLWFHWACCEYWQALGDLGQARREATELCAKAAPPLERTFLALGHRLLAEIAIAERRWDEAQSELACALEIVEGAEIPLAAWRVYATAAELHRCKGHTGEAEAYRRRGAEVIQALADSLDDNDPLRPSLLAHPLLTSLDSKSIPSRRGNVLTDTL